MRNRMLAAWCAPLVALWLSIPAVSAAQPVTPDSVAATKPPVALVVFGDTIAYFEATVAGITPERRASISRERLETMGTRRMLEPVHAEPLDRGHMVLVGDVLAFMFMPGDVAAGTAVAGTPDEDRAAQRLGDALRTRAQAMTLGQRLAALGWSLGATLLLLILLRVLGWARGLALGWMKRFTSGRPKIAKLGDLDIVSHFNWLLTWTIRIASQLGTVTFGVVGVYVLNRFWRPGAWAPPRATIAACSMRYNAVRRGDPGAAARRSSLARFVQRLAADLFAGIERGTIHVPGIHPRPPVPRIVSSPRRLDLAVTTRCRSARLDAFKGVSVFLGLMVTLGSSGVMSHMMSGLVIVYSRSMKAGDIVRINDIEGIVSEVGALSVKLINARKEEFTIPNSVIVGTTVKNYSRQDREAGPVLTTTVTIGYDAPWRVVYEMLLAAAERTAGVRKQPAPAVYQASLTDFYVSTSWWSGRIRSSAFRPEPAARNIQGRVQQRGVQIMSPHFEGQPGERVRPEAEASARRRAGRPLNAVADATANWNGSLP
jgi:hypothetical protein